MGKKIIAIVDYDYPDLSLEIDLIEAAGFAVRTGHAETEDDVVEIANGADGILDQYAPITRSVLERLPACKVVSRYGIGVDTIDYQAASDFGVVVCNVPGYCVHEVSNHAVALMLCMCRRVLAGNAQVKRGEWEFSELTPILAADRSIVGIVGLGNIGKSFAAKAKALGYRCIAYDPYIPESVFTEHGVHRVDFADLLERADVVSLHLPHNDETHHLIDEAALGRMKQSAFLINTSRGRIVDQAALCRALKQNEIAGAGVDVLEDEPPDAHDELLSLSNVVITPHIAYYSEQAYIKMRSTTAQSAVDVLKGRMPFSVVNADVLEKLNLTEGRPRD